MTKDDAGDDAAQRALAAIQSMPERVRNVFVLHRFERLSYGEIATFLGITTGQVEKALRQALMTLMDAQATAGAAESPET